MTQVFPGPVGCPAGRRSSPARTVARSADPRSVWSARPAPCRQAFPGQRFYTQRDVGRDLDSQAEGIGTGAAVADTERHFLGGVGDGRPETTLMCAWARSAASQTHAATLNVTICLVMSTSVGFGFLDYPGDARLTMQQDAHVEVRFAKVPDLVEPALNTNQSSPSQLLS
jgi:hypothetical protein